VLTICTIGDPELMNNIVAHIMATQDVTHYNTLYDIDYTVSHNKPTQ